jgi:hypothetical protein
VEEVVIDNLELKQYLLGRLPAERRKAVERAYFVSEDAYDALRVAEEELFEDHSYGLLGGEDLKAFEGRRAMSVVWHDRMAFDNVLRGSYRKDHLSQRSAKGVVRRAVEWFADLTIIPSVRWGIGVAAVVIVALVGRSWWLQRTGDSQLLADVTFVVDTDAVGTRGGRVDFGTRGTEPGSTPPGVQVIYGTDQYALQLFPRRSLHLYVLQWDTVGNVAVLFPNAEVSDVLNPAPADSVFRIPPSPGWLAVDKDPGVETIGVLASADPWPEVERQLEVIRNGSYPEKMAAFASFRNLMASVDNDQHDGRTAREFSFVLKK